MRFRRFAALLTATLLPVFMVACMSAQQAVQPSSAPKNVIVFVSDGMGYYHVDAASIYEYGETGTQPYEQFPIQLGMATYAATGHSYAGNAAWKDFDYVRRHATDSAAAATAMSTGVKTYGGSIGLDMEKQPLRHMADAAKDLGKSVGIVSSVQLPHATPAGFIAHNERRGNVEEISRQMIMEKRADVMMGTGHPDYDGDSKPVDEPSYHLVGGEEVWNMLTSGGVSVGDQTVADANGDGAPDAWTLVQTKEEFEALVEGDTPARVLGIPMVPRTLQRDRSGDRKAVPPYVHPLIETVPTLETMTRGALNVLGKNPEGFFIMIEGGAVDWAGHGNESGRMIEEMVDFNQSVAAAIEWVEANGGWEETLMIVTADHETGYLTGPGSGNIEQPDGTVEMVMNPLVNNGKGNLPGMQWHSGGHTNVLVPFYAKGAGSDQILRYADEWDPVRGYYINNTDFAKAVFTLYGE